MTIFEVLGILSAIVFIAGDIPYFRDTLTGSTQPHRVTWGVIFLLNVVAFANQYASGADNSLWQFGAVVFATGAIFTASLFRGVGGHTKSDVFSIVAALVGVGLWLVFDSPLLSILANLSATMVAIRPTIVKARDDPESETGSAFLFGMISSVMAAISVGKLDFNLLILHITGIIIQAYIVYLLYIRPKKLEKQKAPHSQGAS